MSTETKIARNVTVILAIATLAVAAIGLSGISLLMYLISPFVAGFGLLLTLGSAFVWFVMFVRGITHPPTSNNALDIGRAEEPRAGQRER